MGRERLEVEFGEYSQWLADAIVAAEVEPVQAACRGTGNPSLFEKLATALDATADTLVLDLGCGIGGPGAWLGSRGCRVVGVDMMEAGVRGLKQLFPASPALVARLRALPFLDDCFSAAWALGVLETVQDKLSAAREVHRVLAPGGRFAIYSFVATGGSVDDAPAADRFEPCAALESILEVAGFDVLTAESAADIAPAPDQWRETAEKVRREVRRLHGTDDGFERVETETAKIRRLVAARAIQPWVFVARKPASTTNGNGGSP